MSTCEWGMRWNARAATGRRATGSSRRVRPAASISTRTESVTPSGTPISMRVWPVPSSPRWTSRPAAFTTTGTAGPRWLTSAVSRRRPPFRTASSAATFAHCRDRLLEDEDVVLAPGGLRHDAEARGAVPEPRAGHRQGHEAEALVEAADARRQELEARAVLAFDRPRAVLRPAGGVERDERAAVELQLEAVGRRAAVQPDVEDVRDRLVGRGRRSRLALPLDRPRGIDGAAQEGDGEAGVAPAVGELAALDAARPALLPAGREDGRRRLGRRPDGRQERGQRDERRSRPAWRHSGSRWTVSGEKAGAQTATYSAPPASGVL